MEVAQRERTPTGLDAFGLKPVRRGHVRGRIQRLNRGTKLTAYGEIMLLDFEFDPGDGQPPVPVRMEGINVMGSLYEGAVVDVADPDPGARPIPARRMRHSHHEFHDVSIYHPDRDGGPTRAGRRLGLALVFGPPSVLALLVGLYYALTGG
jgi:hypothetical protein